MDGDVLPSLRAHCEADHEWSLIPASYWFAVPRCPTCGKPATGFKWGGFVPVEDVFSGIAATCKP
jgi:hypothetical protein